jgi:N-acetylglutamate synthase
MDVAFLEMSIVDYEEVMALLHSTEGMGLSSADSRERVEIFLNRNPGMSFIARDAGLLAGAVFCGHDGRAGYIHHLAVRRSHRGKGIGKTLVERCLSTLRTLGMRKCHIFVFDDNAEALRFWEKIGWSRRMELSVYSRDIV